MGTGIGMGMGIRMQLPAIGLLMRRALNEILRVPGAAIPGILAPTIFLLGLNSIFGQLTDLRGFPTDSYLSFILPISIMQGSSFTGAATGVNLARDIELGWFDRLVLAPMPRWALLAGIVLSASLRALLPVTVLLAVAIPLGAHFPGLDGLVVTVGIAMVMAAVAACYASMIALHFKTQAAAPLMQAGMFTLVLFTTAYAPQELLVGIVEAVAQYNPVTHVVEAARQGFIGSVTWSETWPGLVSLAGMLAAFGGMALVNLRRMTK